MTRKNLLALLLLAGVAGVTLCADRRTYELRPLAPGAGPGDYERFLEHAGRERRYELHVPRGYDPARPAPVVLNFHGGGGAARAARLGCKTDAKADAAGFIAVYPDGTGRFGRLLTWNAGDCCGYAAKQSVDDVGFVKLLLADLAKHVKVDERRVYATGLSNGAMMSYRLACDLADRIAAIAPVAGTLAFDGCEPSRPVPLLHIHGTADENAPYRGGRGRRSLSRTEHRSVADSLERWKTLNRCAGKPEVTTRGHVRTERWTPSPGGAEVTLVTIENGGHVWPGGLNLLPGWLVGSDAGGFDANEAIWEFFSRHALPPAP